MSRCATAAALQIMAPLPAPVDPVPVFFSSEVRQALHITDSVLQIRRKNGVLFDGKELFE